MKHFQLTGDPIIDTLVWIGCLIVAFMFVIRN